MTQHAILYQTTFHAGIMITVDEVAAEVVIVAYTAIFMSQTGLRLFPPRHGHRPYCLPHGVLCLSNGIIQQKLVKHREGSEK